LYAKGLALIQVGLQLVRNRERVEIALEEGRVEMKLASESREGLPVALVGLEELSGGFHPALSTKWPGRHDASSIRRMWRIWRATCSRHNATDHGN
jgi:hypothetical protein